MTKKSRSRYTPKICKLKVLGTKFNVTENGEKGITEVVLHEGSVAVLAGDRTETLVPDQKLTYYHLTGELTVERVAQEAAAADWRAEGIRADLKTVPQLLRMIANYYDLRVVYESSQDSMALAAGELCSIQFRKGDSPNTVLHILSEICQGLEYEINDDTIFIK